MPTTTSDEFRVVPWVFEKTNLNLLNLPLTEMGESLTYNPKIKAKKVPELKKKLNKAKKARTNNTAEPAALPDEELTKEKAKLWLDDMVLAGGLNGKTLPDEMKASSLIISTCLQFCFTGEVQIKETVFYVWSKLRDKIRVRGQWGKT